MINWILRKVFFSKVMKNIRKGYWLEGYNEGKFDQQYNEHLKRIGR
jgi:hypothetical protein